MRTTGTRRCSRGPGRKASSSEGDTMDDKEFDRLWEKFNGRKSGEGDSPYTQELLDEMNGKNKSKVKKTQASDTFTE